MELLLKNRHFYLPFFLSLILFLWLTGTPVESFAQEQIPTVKVKKRPKKPVKINIGKKKKIKDNYQRPKSKSISTKGRNNFKVPKTVTKSGKVKDNYKRPASTSHARKIKASDAKKMASPPLEEGREPASASFWQRLWHKNAPSAYQGKIKVSKGKQQANFESLSKDVHTYEGKLKTRISKQRAERAAIFEGKLKGTTQRQQVARYQKLSKSRSYQGREKVPIPFIQARQKRAASKRRGDSNGPLVYRRRTRRGEIKHKEQLSRNEHQYAGSIKLHKKQQKAGAYSFYQGKIRVRSERYQTRYFRKQAEQVHQFNGLIRVRKSGKDMHPSVSYLKSKTKSSYEQKEKYRKWMLRWHHLFKNSDQPKHLKTKSRKPRYDNKEKDIWYY